MSLLISSLNSGSNGNCYYIGNQQEAILIDAGLTCKETEIRMMRLNLSMQKVKAIFISHEHTDHVKGLSVLANKYKLPVFITDKTKLGCSNLEKINTQAFTAYLPVQIGDLSITAFPKFHDAVDPHSFIVEGNQVTIGVFTDIGKNCERVEYHFKKCDAVFLEANYDADMLEKGNYPFFLKNRISSGHGHLSNHEALDLFVKHRSDQLQYLLLSHLSKDNNHPDLVKNLFETNTKNTSIIVASRYQETPVYAVSSSSTTEIKKRVKKHSVQLEIF